MSLVAVSTLDLVHNFQLESFDVALLHDDLGMINDKRKSSSFFSEKFLHHLLFLWLLQDLPYHVRHQLLSSSIKIRDLLDDWRDFRAIECGELLFVQVLFFPPEIRLLFHPSFF